MAQDLETLLTGLREGKGPAIILLHGDEFRVRGASRAILGLIAPDSDHNLGTTTFDGRSASWDEVEATLMTPSLFVSACNVVVENVPWFAPAERKVDLLDKSLNLWEEGRRDESGRAFMALLRSEGWTREQWLDAGDASETGGHPQGLPGACPGDPGRLAILPRAESRSRKSQGRRAGPGPATPGAGVAGRLPPVAAGAPGGQARARLQAVDSPGMRRRPVGGTGPERAHPP